MNHAELHTGKIWCESVHNLFITFEVLGENVIWSRWSILSGYGNKSFWLVLHVQVLVDSINLTWHHVAKSSLLATNVMTDRQTQTDRQTDKPSDWVKNIIPFFKGIIKQIPWKIKASLLFDVWTEADKIKRKIMNVN